MELLIKTLKCINITAFFFFQNLKTRQNCYFSIATSEHLLLTAEIEGFKGVSGIPAGAEMMEDEGPALAGCSGAGHTGIQEGKAGTGGGFCGTK